MNNLMLAVSMVLCAACGGDDEEGGEPPVIDCATADVPTYAQMTIFDTCTNCHSSELTGEDRNDAEENVNFDTYEAASDVANEAQHEVAEGEMPEGDFEVTAAEKMQLYIWAQCGTPE